MMSDDLKTDSVPDPPREVIDEPEGAASLPPEPPIDEEKQESVRNANKNSLHDGQESPVNGEKQKGMKNESKSFLHPPQDATFSTKKKSSPKPGIKLNKTRKQGRSPEPTSMTSQISISHSNNIQIGPRINVNVDKNSSGTKQECAPKETKTIRALRDSTETATLEHVRVVQSHVGESWREVGRKLDLTDGNLYQLKVDYDREGMKEVVYQMMRRWLQMKGSEATVGELTNALWTSSEYSAVKKLAEWAKGS